MVRLVLIAVFAALCAVGAAEWLGAAVGGPASQPAAVAATPAANAAPETPLDGEASIPKSGDGHFWADAQVDGHPVRFLVDTGATAVSLTPDDARTLGIDPGGLNYSYTVMTANGPGRAAAVKLGEITVGGAQVSDVQAFVIDKGLPTSLLGMSYLGRLSKFEASQDAMVLHS
jgi:aspartyl protease family protein